MVSFKARYEKIRNWISAILFNFQTDTFKKNLNLSDNNSYSYYSVYCQLNFQTLILRNDVKRHWSLREITDDMHSFPQKAYIKTF